MTNTVRGLVLFSFGKHPKGYYDTLFGRLSERAREHGMELERGALKDMRIHIGNDNFRITESRSECDLQDFDVVYFELWSKCPQQALAASVYLKMCDVPFLGPSVERIQPDTKIGELSLLKQAGVSVPETVSSSSRQLRRWFRQSTPLKFPVVIKNAAGYGGKVNFLVQSEPELLSVLEENSDTTFVVQEFIPNDRDYRFLIMGGEIQAVIERTGGGETHLNNTSKGASARLMEPNEFSASVRQLAKDSAETVGRSEFAGVDIVFHQTSQQPYVLEVNKTPQIEIGAYPEKKMDALLDYLARLSNAEEIDDA